MRKTVKWNYDFFNGKPSISSADIEDFEAHIQTQTDNPDTEECCGIMYNLENNDTCRICKNEIGFDW